MMEVMDIRREVLRNVVLCQGLEALARKTRLQATAPGPKPEHFLVAGVNSAWPFYDLADRILTAGGQPDCIFDTAYAAQASNVRNHLGGKVSYGPVSLLIPVVTAQVLEYLETGTHEDIDAILARTGDVLRNTTEKDVESLEEYIRLDYEVTAKSRERAGDPKPRRSPVLKGRFTNVLDAVADFTRNPNVREMSHGFPFSHQVYRFLLHNLDGGILPASALISQLLLAELQRPDVVADFVAVGIYLVLSKHPESVLLS
jgi:hypothetical protein